MRDIAYEQALIRHQRKMLRVLDEYSLEEPNAWKERDLLAIQRALQVYYRIVYRTGSVFCPAKIPLVGEPVAGGIGRIEKPGGFEL